jgi:hypothetical protein
MLVAHVDASGSQVGVLVEQMRVGLLRTSPLPVARWTSVSGCFAVGGIRFPLDVQPLGGCLLRKPGFPLGQRPELVITVVGQEHISQHRLAGAHQPSHLPQTSSCSTCSQTWSCATYIGTGRWVDLSQTSIDCDAAGTLPPPTPDIAASQDHSRSSTSCSLSASLLSLLDNLICRLGEIFLEGSWSLAGLGRLPQSRAVSVTRLAAAETQQTWWSPTHDPWRTSEPQ